MDSAGGFVVPPVDLGPGQVLVMCLARTDICFCREKEARAVEAEEKQLSRLPPLTDPVGGGNC